MAKKQKKIAEATPSKDLDMLPLFFHTTCNKDGIPHPFPYIQEQKVNKVLASYTNRFHVS